MKECNSCGKCCIKYSNGGLSASRVEIERWDMLRPDIFAYVHDNEIWNDPQSGNPLELCPFLREDPRTHRYLCDIYLDRPDDCKFYPTSIEEMILDGCEMIEAKDLAYPKQAQKDLDRIMVDSRTPRT